MSRFGTVLSFIVVVAVIAALVWTVHPGHTVPTVPANLSCPDCNVIIIGVDTLRADHVHALGYPLDTTPTLDSLAAHGFVFTQAISASDWTVPSFMSIMTGVFPSVHKVTNKYVVFDPKNPANQVLANLHALSPTIETLAQQFKAAGYATGGFTGDAGVGHGFGYNQGFDVYTDETTFGDFDNSDTHALAWLDSLQKGQKFFMFFHGYDLHGQHALPKNEQVFVPKNYKGPYTGTPAEEAKLREAVLTPQGVHLTAQDAAFWAGLYDSKLRAADTKLSTFLDQLKGRGLLDKTIIVVVSDHGEEFYEHGAIDHGQSLYDELIHVPLIIDLPSASTSSTIVGQVSTMDIGPSLLAMVGIQGSSQYQSQVAGRPNLLAYLASSTTPGYDVFDETDYRDYIHERSVRTAGGWKYILNLVSGKEELYNLVTDPGEKTNLIAQEPSQAEALRTELRAHVTHDLHEDLSAPASVGCLPVYKGECE